MNEIDKAQAILAISNEVSATQDRIAVASITLMQASQSLSAIQFRLQELMHQVLEAQPPADIRENPDFGVAVETHFGDVPSSPDTSPQAQDGREIVTAASTGAAGVERGSDARALGTGDASPEMKPQSEQAVSGDVPGSTGAPPEDDLDPPECYDSVLDRFAATGQSHQDLAGAFAVRIGDVSRCLQIARGRNDRRAAAGDLKRGDLIEGNEPAEGEAARHTKRRGKATHSASVAGTIEPRFDQIGLTLVTVMFTDGVAVRPDTNQDVRLPGPLLRILALFKDQQWYPLPDVMKASRDNSEAVFRSKLIDLRRGLKSIGLTVVEDGARGFQLRRLSDGVGSTEAA